MPSRPRGTESGGNKEHNAEMNDGRSSEGIDLVLARLGRRIRNQRHHDELQAGQRSRGRSDDYVKVLPQRKRLVRWHKLNSWNGSVAAPSKAARQRNQSSRPQGDADRGDRTNSQ